MSSETCLKCGHVNPAATGSDTEACPQCGAIYARVKAAMASGQAVRPVKSADPRAPTQGAELAAAVQPTAHPKPAARAATVVERHRAPYVAQLRAGTNYPTFRTVVRLGLFFGYLLAVAALIGGGIAAFKSDGTPWHLLIGAGMGAVLYLLTRIWFELTVMIVDIADASVRTAENSEPREAS